ncbi:MAG: phosphate acyltransferase, partial [Kordiimonas sp.]
RTVFMADTTVNEKPSAQELADIAESAAFFVKRLGHDPRVAFLSFSNFGNPPSGKTAHIRDAVSILDERDVNFEYDGEMQADVALNRELMELYPFMRLSGPANILIMPALHSANIAYKLLSELGDSRVVGPMLLGMDKSVQIARMTSTASDLVTVAGLAASNAHALDHFKAKMEK